MHDRGFTLIEVMAVITIIAVLLYFSVPVFKPLFPEAGTKGNAERFALLIQSLKQKAVDEQMDYFLRIDPGTGSVSVTHEAMDKDIHRTENRELLFLKDLVVTDVEFPGIRETRPHFIRFGKEGYSDMALVHIRADGKDITLKIEPFLSRVEQAAGFVSYHECM